MKEITLKVKRLTNSNLPLPTYMSEHASGLDLMADIETDIELKPMQRVIVPTGISVEIPEGYEAEIRPRSGLAIRHGITLLNSPGTIDADYRGEIKIILVNLGNETFRIRKGDRIAQMVIKEVVKANIFEVDKLSTTKRENGGFGHTGI